MIKREASISTTSFPLAKANIKRFPPHVDLMHVQFMFIHMKFYSDNMFFLGRYQPNHIHFSCVVVFSNPVTLDQSNLMNLGKSSRFGLFA